MKTNTQGLNNFLKKVTRLTSEHNVIANRVVEELADKGVDALNKRYSAIDYDIGANKLPIVFSETQENRSKVIAQGKQVAYIEFGTGNVGAKTIFFDALDKKFQVGAMPYNSGKTIHFPVPILDERSSSGKNEYRKVLGWYKPHYALNDEERARYERWVAGLERSIKDPTRLFRAKQRAWKYTHGTEGIKAGQQIFLTARGLEMIAPKVVKQIVKEEINK